VSAGDAQLGQVAPRRTVAVAAWAALLVAGLALWIVYALGDDPGRAWRAMLINFIYFTPLAAGMVTWPALLTAARSTWLAPVRRTALAAAAFAPVSLAAFAALWFGREHWAAWLHMTGLHNAAWINEPFLFVRDAAALVLFWTLAIVFVIGAARWRTRKLHAVVILVYALVLTLLGFDVVMALDPHWFSTLFGGYFFISGLYAGMAAWTLASLLERPSTGGPRSVVAAMGGERSDATERVPPERPQPDAEHRHDMAKLLVAFSILTTYMMYSQLIPIWYEALPEEVRFVVPRLTQTPWVYVSAALLGVVYLGPLVFLLPVRARRSRWYLGGVAAVVLAGLWVERWWLVTPTLGGPMIFGLVEISITVAFLAALVLGMGWLRPRLPEADAGVALAACPPVCCSHGTGGQAASGTRPADRPAGEGEAP
jgi:hypothetical protein